MTTYFFLSNDDIFPKKGQIVYTCHNNKNMAPLKNNIWGWGILIKFEN